MPDYARMYKHLFNVQTDVIITLQNAHRETEGMHLSSPEPDIQLLDFSKPEEENE